MSAPLTFSQRNEKLAALEKLAVLGITDITRAAVHASNAVVHNTSDQAERCRELATLSRRLTEIAEALAEDALHRQ
ncbi:hypothetical protein [Nocardia tengchongensis]|uniref:hypothetical protein n=1 Tax=Nocardia tengchongensis TaxID=2055889 RepID=UPI00365D38F1